MSQDISKSSKMIHSHLWGEKSLPMFGIHGSRSREKPNTIKQSRFTEVWATGSLISLWLWYAFSSNQANTPYMSQTATRHTRIHYAICKLCFSSPFPKIPHTLTKFFDGKRHAISRRFVLTTAVPTFAL